MFTLTITVHRSCLKSRSLIIDTTEMSLLGRVQSLRTLWKQCFVHRGGKPQTPRRITPLVIVDTKVCGSKQYSPPSLLSPHRRNLTNFFIIRRSSEQNDPAADPQSAEPNHIDPRGAFRHLQFAGAIHSHCIHGTRLALFWFITHLVHKANRLRL